MIGSCNWAITLGRIDVYYATSTLSRFNGGPMQGHLKALTRVLGYLKDHSGGRMIIDTDYRDNSKFTIVEHQNWKEFYPAAKDEIPDDMPKPKGKPVRITVYVDASHAHDQVTRRSVTGILIFLNNTPIRWISKKQKTVETSTYGSELVAARIAVEGVIDLMYHLRMIGVPIDGPAMMLGDNQSVILNTSVPSSVLKKKHNAIAYHKVREACAASIIRFCYVESGENLSDCLTKPLDAQSFYKLLWLMIFRQPNHLMKEKEKGEIHVEQNNNNKA